jgi:hypothetical protein
MLKNRLKDLNLIKYQDNSIQMINPEDLSKITGGSSCPNLQSCSSNCQECPKLKYCGVNQQPKLESLEY